MSQSLIDEYAQTLSALAGNDFQSEVSARLQSVIIDFQVVPAKPQGDAGLDAFSHGGVRAYCCYGPEHDEFKTNPKRERGIADKFCSDLRRLFELDYDNGKLVIKESPEMATILPDGCKIEHIELVVNWFESHRVLGPIHTALAEYKKVSKCRYVSKNASVIVTGPKQLASRFAIDELTIMRARQRIFVQTVLEKAEAVDLGSTEKFDEKMAVLVKLLPDKSAEIQILSQKFQTAWRIALAFEQELHDTVPNLHRDFERNRGHILTKVLMLMMNSKEPWSELENATAIAEKHLEKDFEKLYGVLIPDVSSGEIGRLIGECPIGWREPH